MSWTQTCIFPALAVAFAIKFFVTLVAILVPAFCVLMLIFLAVVWLFLVPLETSIPAQI
jgi:hypothetical protein